MSNANIEAIKEVLRWVIFFVGSWIVSELLRQIDLVPESWLLKIYVFTFMIPARSLFVFGLTMAARYIDKYLHVNSKEDKAYQIGQTPPSGLLPF